MVPEGAAPEGFPLPDGLPVGLVPDFEEVARRSIAAGVPEGGAPDGFTPDGIAPEGMPDGLGPLGIAPEPMGPGPPLPEAAAKPS